MMIIYWNMCPAKTLIINNTLHCYIKLHALRAVNWLGEFVSGEGVITSHASLCYITGKHFKINVSLIALHGIRLGIVKTGLVTALSNKFNILRVCLHDIKDWQKVHSINSMTVIQCFASITWIIRIKKWMMGRLASTATDIFEAIVKRLNNNINLT